MERPGAVGIRRQTPARRADGPSVCPGGSPFEPGGVSAKAAIPGGMQQAAKSIRVRNAGGFLRLRPVPRLFGPLDRVTR